MAKVGATKAKERCRVLLHLIDGTCEDAGAAYKTVRHELECYGADLADKTEIVALNKADAIDPEHAKAQIAKLKRAAKKTPYLISAATGTNIDEIKRALIAIIDEANEAERDIAHPPEPWRP